MRLTGCSAFFSSPRPKVQKDSSLPEFTVTICPAFCCTLHPAGSIPLPSLSIVYESSPRSLPLHPLRHPAASGILCPRVSLLHALGGNGVGGVAGRSE